MRCLFRTFAFLQTAEAGGFIHADVKPVCCAASTPPSTITLEHTAAPAASNSVVS